MNSHSNQNMASKSPLLHSSRRIDQQNHLQNAEDRRLPALHCIPPPIAYSAPSDIGLMPWGPPQPARTGELAHKLEEFENFKLGQQHTVGSAGNPMKYWLHDTDSPRAFLQPGATLGKSHPNHSSPSEPAWSHHGSESFHQYGAHESTADTASEYHSAYGFPTTASSWSGSPGSKEKVEFSPTWKNSPYPASDNNSEPEPNHIYSVGRGPYINPQDISSQPSGSGSDDEDADYAVPAIRLNNTHELGNHLYQGMQQPMEVEPTSTNLSPTSPSAIRFSHRRVRSGSGVSAGIPGPMDSPTSPGLLRSLSNGSKPRTRRSGNQSKVSKPRDGCRRDGRRQSQTNQVRPFYCSFLFANCKSTFATKNEWKRHVQSQHMQQYIWRCDFAQCADRKAAIFNRKDLFGQHLKRMHAPRSETGARCNSKTNTPEMSHFLSSEMPKIQERCKVERRPPPQHTVCGFCQKIFIGKESWEKRMEHVGRHYENGDNVGPEQWTPDTRLIEWALREGLVKKADNGGYTVAASGKEAAVESGA